jgi:hypothetical protein
VDSDETGAEAEIRPSADLFSGPRVAENQSHDRWWAARRVAADKRWIILIISNMADREGFEPSNGFHRYTLSRRAPSTTRPPVLTKNALKYTAPPRTARSPEREALQRLIACAASRQRRRCLIGDHRLTAFPSFRASIPKFIEKLPDAGPDRAFIRQPQPFDRRETATHPPAAPPRRGGPPRSKSNSPPPHRTGTSP